MIAIESQLRCYAFAFLVRASMKRRKMKLGVGQ